ncbi:MAG: hypothetical protein IT304_03425 [Dehalococcoidia bacterium]|nr:hypothetical protein [Dehalococcoidia bacterium]
MSSFWVGLVRLPALVLLVLALASGGTGVAAWAPALSAALFFGVIAQVAGALGRRAVRRKRRRAELAAAAGRVSMLPKRAQPRGRRAA